MQCHDFEYGKFPVGILQRVLSLNHCGIYSVEEYQNGVRINCYCQQLRYLLLDRFARALLANIAPVVMTRETNASLHPLSPLCK
jgi:hypothetical protein